MNRTLFVVAALSALLVGCNKPASLGDQQSQSATPPPSTATAPADNSKMAANPPSNTANDSATAPDKSKDTATPDKSKGITADTKDSTKDKQ